MLYGVFGIVEFSVEYVWLLFIVDKLMYVWGGFLFLGIYLLLWCFLDLFFMICWVMKKIINRLIVNNVEILVMMVILVVISLFFIKINFKFYFKYMSIFIRLIKVNC